VLLALELAKELGADEVEVVNDSELVARQIGGEYKVKHAGLKPLHAETMEKLREFDGWAVRNVRREQNERADELVNEALDRESG
jgi:ribonuclease HI